MTSLPNPQCHKRFPAMSNRVENVHRMFPPRPLTDGERAILLGWTLATKDFSTFVSERRSDDPAVYRRIIVSRRVNNRRLYMIHAHQNSDYWIMVSAADGEDVGHFPTLRAALNFINPVTLSTRIDGSSSDDNHAAAQPDNALPEALAMIRDMQNRLDTAEQDLKAVQTELAAEREARQRAEETARAALNAVAEWRSRKR